MRAAVIGGGIMGSGIALALARAGHGVVVVETDGRRALALAERWRALDIAADTNLRVVTEFDVLADAGFIIEAVPEVIDLKRAVWTRLGHVAGSEAILATNTSSLDVDVLAAEVPHPGRVLATHWFNPAYEIECVEVAPGRATEPRVLEETLSILRSVGKSPVVVRNSPGFVANRIQFAAIREALLCVQEGMPPSDVDEIVRTSFAPRLAALGPLANADLGGLDTYLSVFEVLSAAHGKRFEAPEILGDLVAEGRFGTKTGAGISSYTPDQVDALVALRDARLSRIIRAVDPDANIGILSGETPHA